MSKKRIKEIESQLVLASDAYYNETPIMTDSEFDKLRDELKKLDPDNSIINSVGFSVKSPLSKVKHKIPMGSLEKVNTEKEVSDWFDKYVLDKELVCSEKIDGLSVSITYKDGAFVQGVTRGDGEVGEDVTHALVKANFPKKLKKKVSLEIRGEVFITNKDYSKFFSDKKNVRNAAAGTLRRLDAERSEHLQVKFYQVDIDVKTEEEKMKFIESLGLDTPNWKKVKTLSEIQKLWIDYENGKRSALDYEIDGLVLVSNSVQNQQEQGVVNGRPRFARAYKFSSQEETTEILEVINQVGRTGIISPVAKIKPTTVTGALISSVYLYNYKEISDLNLKLNQKVVIARKGDVIPKITMALEDKGSKIEVPKNCPCCGTKLVPAENLINIYCPNSQGCREQLLQNLLFFLETLQIKGIAFKMVEKLYDSGKVKKVEDFFKLTNEDISSLERSGDKLASKIIKEIQSKTEQEPELFLASLGIDELGNGTSKLLMENYKISELFDLTSEDFLKIHGIGEITAKALVQGLSSRKKEIFSLLKVIKIKEKVQGSLSGKSFCFTEVRDKALEADLKAQGAVISDSVNKTLSYLIVKDVNGSSSKIEKARKNNVPIIPIEDVRKKFF